MPFKFSFEVNPVGITVPYPPVTDDIRRNRGFVDLRGKPESAAIIAEVAESPALRNLLMRMAQEGSHIFSIGCDLGSHTEQARIRGHQREVAGGYVQLAGMNYEKIEPDSYNAVAHLIARSVRRRAKKDHWVLDCIGTWVDFKFEGETHGLRPTLWIWFFAASKTATGAAQSRERLIEAIDTAVAEPTIKSIMTA